MVVRGEWNSYPFNRSCSGLLTHLQNLREEDAVAAQPRKTL